MSRWPIVFRLRSWSLRARVGALGYAACAGAAVACTTTEVPTPPVVCGAPQSSASSAANLSAANTAFAMALYEPVATAAGAGKNMIFSPYSVSSALLLVDVGANGKTASQIETTLHIPSGGATMAPAYAALACETETDGMAGGNQLAVANAVWGQQGFAFKPAFTSVLSSGYLAPLQRADFAGNVPGAVGAINAWASNETKGAIPMLVDVTDVPVRTRLVLAATAYFKGAWELGFDPTKTSPQSFTLSNGSIVQVPTMSGDVDVASGYANNASVYELPYKGGLFALDVVLPPGPGTLGQFESTLTADGLQALLSSVGQAASQPVLLPKFAFQTHLALTPLLAGLGIPDLFDPQAADLSGMDGARDLYVSTVIQDALIAVDEQGTVAAAATAAGAQPGVAVEPITIDRPFLFLIRDTKTNTIFFMGHVEDPRQN